MTKLRDTEVTAGTLAKWLGISRYAATRKLHQVAKLRPDIIHRRGRTLWAFASELTPYVPGLKDTPLHASVRGLAAQVRELERRMDAMVRERTDARARKNSEPGSI
jgi:hypothetical protein